MNNDIIRLSKAAKYFNVSRTTIWRWRKNGIIRPYEIGGISYIRVSDILNLSQNDQTHKS